MLLLGAADVRHHKLAIVLRLGRLAGTREALVRRQEYAAPCLAWQQSGLEPHAGGEVGRSHEVR